MLNSAMIALTHSQWTASFRRSALGCRGGRGCSAAHAAIKGSDVRGIIRRLTQLWKPISAGKPVYWKHTSMPSISNFRMNSLVSCGSSMLSQEVIHRHRAWRILRHPMGSTSFIADKGVAFRSYRRHILTSEERGSRVISLL